MILYIAGPMTGMPELNYPLFNTVEQILRGLGYDILNPARQSAGLTWAQYMRLGLKDVTDADAIALLPHWGDSKGALLETYVARELNMQSKPWQEWAENAHWSKRKSA